MTFAQALKSKDFVVTAQLRLTGVVDSGELLRQADKLAPLVDALHLTELKDPHISGTAAAALLLQHDIDPILHMNCRDRNRVAMQKDLLGAAALGVTSVLVTRGSKIANSKKLGVRNVYDTTALEFMAYIQELKQDEVAALATDFKIGANAELFSPRSNWTPKNLVRKCDAGVSFVQMQICFDLDVARKYMARIVEAKLTHKASFILALSPLPSAEIALWIRDNVKGALVPDAVIGRLEQAADPEAEGIRLCADLMQEAQEIPGVSGVTLLSLDNLDATRAAIETFSARSP